jgi:hypothetical protein
MGIGVTGHDGRPNGGTSWGGNLMAVGKGMARVSAEDFANKYDPVRNGMKSNRKAKKKSKEK